MLTIVAVKFNYLRESETKSHHGSQKVNQSIVGSVSISSLDFICNFVVYYFVVNLIRS